MLAGSHGFSSRPPLSLKQVEDLFSKCLKTSGGHSLKIKGQLVACIHPYGSIFLPSKEDLRALIDRVKKSPFQSQSYTTFGFVGAKPAFLHFAARLNLRLNRVELHVRGSRDVNPGQVEEVHRIAEEIADEGKGQAVSSLGVWQKARGVSKGIGYWVSGRARFRAEAVQSGDIFVKTLMDPSEDVEAMEKAGGLVTTQGTEASHAAVTARGMHRHAIILEGASIRTRPLGKPMELILGTGRKRLCVREGDYLRVAGDAQGGGVWVISAEDFSKFSQGEQIRFWLEELLWSAGPYEKANVFLKDCGTRGELLACVREEAELLYVAAVASAEKKLKDQSLSPSFQRKTLQELLEGLKRLSPFSDPTPSRDVSLAIFEERLTSLKAEEARYDLAASTPVTAAAPVELVHSDQLIIKLSEVDRRWRENVGPKFARLGDVSRLGMKVPRGIGLSHYVFEKFLDAAGIRSSFETIRGKIEGLLQGRDLEDATLKGLVFEQCVKMMDLLRQAKGPDEFWKPIEMAIHEETKGAPLAVRSSGIREDDEAGSQAGIYKTRLNVVTPSGEDLHRAIRDVWASFWNPVVVSFRHKRGEPHAPALAVAIQEMIMGEVSGVIFSQDPTREEGGVVILSALGLCEGVVGGKVRSDIYHINRDGSVSVEVMSKDSQTVANEKGGTKLEEVELKRVAVPSMSKARATELGKVAQRLRQEFGFEVNIEYTFKGGKVYILQVRPMVGRRSGRSSKPPRERAVQLLKESTRPSLYFVCTGNTHRSAAMHLLMERVLVKHSLDSVEVSSGGIAAIEDEELDPKTRTLLRKAKVPEAILEDFRTSKISEDIGQETLIIVAEQHMRDLLVLSHGVEPERVFLYRELAPQAFSDSETGVRDPNDSEWAEMILKLRQGSEELFSLISEGIGFESWDDRDAKKFLGTKAIEASLWRRHPDLMGVFQEAGWTEAQGRDLVTYVTYFPKAMENFFERYFHPRAEDIIAEMLKAVLQNLRDTGWSVDTQLKVLKFTSHAYSFNIMEAVFGDIFLATLCKIEQVMNAEEIPEDEKKQITASIKASINSNQVQEVAEWFARRGRFVGLEILIKDFGAVFPLSADEAEAAVARFEKDENYATAHKLAALAGLPQDPPQVMLAQEEMSRRANRSPRPLDQKRKILFDEIAVFYLIQKMKADVTELEKRRLPEKERGLVAGLKRSFDEQEASLFAWIREYLIYAVHSELENQKQWDFLGKHVGIFMSGHEALSVNVSSFLKLATDEEIRIFLMQAMQRFSSKDWGDAQDKTAGSRWVKIAQIALNMWQAKKPNMRLVDKAFNLKHNTALAFDKKPEEIIVGHEDSLPLDLRNQVRSVETLYRGIEVELSPKVRDTMRKWLNDLQAVRTALKV